MCFFLKERKNENIENVYTVKCGALSMIRDVDSVINNEKQIRHARSTTIALNFQSFCKRSDSLSSII